MRKESFFRMGRAESLLVLAGAEFVHLATTTAEGAPVLRALNFALLDDSVVFHGAAVGEKAETLGRPAVVSATEHVATLPSYFVDPERACPATTLYRSVQVHGELRVVEDSTRKARALTALMAKHQPEGGFVPIDAAHPLYAREIASLLVFEVSLERLDGKAKLAQNRKPEERTRVLEGLWRRGAPGDLLAIERILAANQGAPTPPFLCPLEGVTLSVSPDAEDAARAADLLAGTYWNGDFTREELIASHLGSSAWVVARGADGELLASARAISDGAKRAWIYDVIVAEPRRGTGLGERLMRLLLDHPSLRDARLISLGTRDAAGFYERLGFRRRDALPRKAYVTIEMVLAR